MVGASVTVRRGTIGSCSPARRGFLAVTSCRLRARGMQGDLAARPGGHARMAAAVGLHGDEVAIVEASLHDERDCRRLLSRLLDGSIHLAAGESGHAEPAVRDTVTPTRRW